MFFEMLELFLSSFFFNMTVLNMALIKMKINNEKKEPKTMVQCL